jgi:hypothetical protein
VNYEELTDEEIQRIAEGDVIDFALAMRDLVPKENLSAATETVRFRGVQRWRWIPYREEGAPWQLSVHRGSLIAVGRVIQDNEGRDWLEIAGSPRSWRDIPRWLWGGIRHPLKNQTATAFVISMIAVGDLVMNMNPNETPVIALLLTPLYVLLYNGWTYVDRVERQERE